jgi:hypothetical protein
MNLTIVIPSKGRAGKVSTLKLIPEATLVVPYNELNDYVQAYPDFVVVCTPKSVKNIVASRQWILEQFPNVFMIDDDVTAIHKMYESDSKYMEIEDPEEIIGIIYRLADMAKDLGAKMFGFGNCRTPVQYRSHEPFKFTGYQNASYCGFLEGHDLMYDLSYSEGEDHYISCLNIYRHRFMLIDTRYAVFTKDNFKGEGGCSTDRTLTEFQENTIRLRKTFGEVVHMKSASGGKKTFFKGERTLSFPF